MEEFRGADGRPPIPWSAVRASDAERNQVVELLQQHFVEGRLTPDELTERVDQVYSARTRGDLQQPLHDLPPLPTAPAEPETTRRSGNRRVHPGTIALRIVAAIVLLFIAGAVFEEATPVVLLIALVVWMANVRARRRRSGC